MTDKPTIEEKPEEIIREVTFSLPDHLTIGQWNVYNGARLEYNARTQYPDFNLARWYGAAALVKKGIVHIKGFDELVKALNADNADDCDSSFLDAVIIYIARPIEEIANRPLADYLRGSSVTGKILINGLPL